MEKLALVFISLLLMTGIARADEQEFSLTETDLISNKPITLEGEITLPDKAKWTAVFVLHGCDGVTQFSRPVLEEHASFYQNHGFATIVLDSWGPRNLSAGSCDAESEEARAYADPAVRVADIETVTKYLTTLPGFDGKIILDGLSHGGWVAFSVLTSVGDEPLKAEVAGIVGWYPRCDEIDPTQKVPTLVLAGGRDQNPYTSPAVCTDAAKRYNWVETKVFDNATHAFDYPYPSTVAGASGRIRYDGAAKNAAYQRLEAWLKEKGLD